MSIRISPDRTQATINYPDFTASFINGGWVKHIVYDEEQTKGFVEITYASVKDQLLAQAHQTIDALGTGHLVLFSDGCPTDFLENDPDSARWHTIAFCALQIKELPNRLPDGTVDVNQIVSDELYSEFFSNFRMELPRPKKWDAGRSRGYKIAFCKAFGKFSVDLPVWVNAISFQEKTLRQSKDALIKFYNRRSWAGHDIGFNEFLDRRGRLIMEHQYVSMHGHRQLSRRVEQMLVILLMTCCLADQHLFYFQNIVIKDRHNADILLTLVSDTLSGDDDLRRDSEYILHHLIDPHYNSPFAFGRSPGKREELGDLLADNIAGWLTNALNNPTDELSDLLFEGDTKQRLDGWRILQPMKEFWETSSAWEFLSSLRNI